MQRTYIRTREVLSNQDVATTLIRFAWLLVDTLSVLLFLRFLSSLIGAGQNSIQTVTEPIVSLFPVYPLVLDGITIDLPALFAIAVIYLIGWMVADLFGG